MKKAKFWILISVYLCLAFADGALTYINTPDLSFEANPLVAKLGLGWGALAIANIAVFALCFASAYYAYFKYKTVFTKETKYTRYWSQITLDRPDMFWKGFILPPKHWKPYIAAFGFSIFPAAIIARLILVLEWLDYTFNVDSIYLDNYYYFENTYCFGCLDVFAAVIIELIGVFYWFYLECKKQRETVEVPAE
ncbi:MAG: hypothetical protein J6J13_00200 [Clostridia bacterium]|nr:hypothetical protein [Clostridia bacterium]